ncbi:MAG: plastocyanin/azurin family copper-binding protein [Kofleriaceae bacterium]
MTIKTLLCALALVMLPAGSPSATPSGGTVTGKAFVTAKGKVVASENLWVYLIPAVRRKATPRTASISQRKQDFIPHALVVPVGSTIAFPNDDREEHNVFSNAPKQFDLGRYTGGKSKSQTFELPDEYDIYCDIHAGMWTQVKVVDSDFIAKVAPDGRFTIANVPPGKYKVVAWRPRFAQPDQNEVKASVEIVEGKTATIEEMHVPAPPAQAAHRRKDGSTYPFYP